MKPAAQRPRRLGLRARVIIAFAVGALLLSVLLSAVTYSLTRNNLVEQRIGVIERNAVVNAQEINSELGRAAFLAGIDDGSLGEVTAAGERTFMEDLVQRFAIPQGSNQGLRVRGNFYWTDGLTFSEDRLPQSLNRSIFPEFPDEAAAEMVFDGGSESFYAIVLPLPFSNTSASYIQAASLGEIEDALRSLRTTLFGASAVTTILGLGFGVYVATRIFNPLGEISGAAEQIAAGDLTTRLDQDNDPDLESLVASFNNMTSALQERIERDARFASDVSHELRSPLMTLTGSAAVLEKRRDDLPERAQIALDLLTNDIRRFKQLVEDLLEISRFDVGAVQLERDEVLLSEFVKQALHAATGGAREIPIEHGADADDLIALIDKRRLAQVIRNLSENADKYAGGLSGARLVRVGEAGVAIELEDRGPGVPVDERELIFERFSRGSEGGRRGSGTGVGLGLSLVVEHLRLHDASIRVDDRADGGPGARFVIELPGVVIDE